MAVCAGCRVRHLNCDTQPTCTECEKSGRECVRLNVRFRHLVCPSGDITRADYSKYQFSFDRQQTWLDTNGKVEFVAGSDSSADASPTQEQDNNIFDAVGLNAKSRPGPMEEPSSKFVYGPTSYTPAAQASGLDDEPPDYLAAIDQAPQDHSIGVIPKIASKMSAQSLSLMSQPGEKLSSDTSVLVVRPLKSLQEGKLFQQFITHLAPWVCLLSTWWC